MSFVNSKHIKIFYIILFSFFLSNCQLKEPNKTHGINFLENREKVLIIGKTNKNDVIKLIGYPHTVSIKNDDTWIFFERTITRGKLVKLGQNVLKNNNLLELKFNKYGVLKNKKIYNKEDMKKIKYSEVETENNISQKSFVGKFLSSIRQKMYGKNKF
jgi:outer membrane protein assembly factor BamE (lipoprotein component of BamABCDE complex)